MQRVLHIIWNANFGGIEKLVFELAEEQNKTNNFEACVMIAKAEGEFLDKFQNGSFDCHFLNLKGGFSLNLNSFSKALRVFSEYQILHLHFFNPLIALAMLFSKKQIVYTEHGNFGFGRKKKRSDNLMFFLKKRFLHRSDIALTFNSQFTKTYAEKAFGITKKAKSTLIYNGINLSSANESIKAKSDQKKLQLLKEKLADQFVVGTSSRFVGFKRIDRLISAFGKTAILENSILLLVGDGVLMPQLKKLVKELNLEDRVIFTGFVEDVQSYQELFDISVFPSSKEPFGLVAVETLCLGKPTIVFEDGGGLVEIIKGTSKEDIVKNEHDLISRIHEYGNGNQTETEIKERKQYAKGFSIEIMAKKFETVYLKGL